MWGKTQAVVALSSADAELHGVVRASAETVGLISMYKDFGTHMSGVVLGDASAALSIVARRGLGKLRHLDTNYLWIQEKAAKGDLNFKKVAGVDNGADLFTKTLSCDEIQSHIHKLTQFIQCELRRGSAKRSQSSSSTARIGYCRRPKPWRHNEISKH